MAFKKKIVAAAVVAPKAAAIDAAEKTQVLEVAKKAVERPDQTLKELTDVQLSLGQRIAEVQKTLGDQIKTVADLDKAIALKKDELSQWGEVKDLTITLDELRANIENERANAASAKEERDAAWAQAEKDRADERQREESLYAIRLNATRAEQEAQYDAKRAELKRTHADQDIERERAYRARVDALALQEKELVDLRKAAAEFPAKLAAEVSAAEGRVRGIMSREYAQQSQLASKDAEVAAKLAENTIAGLQAANTAQLQRNASLEEQVREANKRIETMAVKVAEASSGRQALAAVQELSASSGNQPTSGRR